ncbi:MAG TPA: SLC13 family permease [Planctomycetota bacterium]|nr:SLC13 family permease [Planctomycetota bacterium]
MTWTFQGFASLLIFIATYVLISVHRIRFLNLDRPSAALAGAVLMVLLGVVPFDEALRSTINWETILLLLGMMIVVAILKLACFFEFVSAWILIRAGSPGRLLALLIAASGVLSALFVNDTICVLFTPVVLAAVLRAKLNPVPFLIALVTSANIGSVMTLTGNPQNMLVGIFSRIPYGVFFLYLLPVGVAGLLLNWLVLRWLYARELEGSFETAGLALPAVDRPSLVRVLGVVGLISVGFILPLERWLPGLEAGQKLPLVALAGAALAILVGRTRPTDVLAQVDWGLLVFFAGLFVVIGGINRTGLLPALHARAALLFGPSGGGLTLFTVAMSNLVSNVPYVLVVQKWISGSYAWTLIAMASTFAGNLTIVGSVANMIVLELSRDRARIGFVQYLKAGVPVTLLTTGAGFLLLYLFHAAAWL